MLLGRIFANAIARRVAYLLVAVVLAWMGLGEAKAQSSCPNSAGNTCTQGSAYTACMAQAVTENSGWTWANKRCTHEVISGSWAVYSCLVDRTRTSDGAANNNSGCQADNQFWYLRANSCSARASSVFSSDIVIPTGSSGCSSGCEFDVHNNGDGTYTRYFSTAGDVACDVLPSCTTPGWYLNHATSLCQPPEEECPSNQTKNPKTKQCEEACPTGMVMDPTGACKPAAEECPAGNVRAPSGECLPGEGQCAAGEARRPNGTCGRDSDGDGVADEDDNDPENDPDRETASGGDSCNSPPSCSGGPIMCLQAKIQWRIDCNTRRNLNISGGTCGAMPVCVGEKCDALEYSQLLMQWRSACALERLDLGEGGAGGGADETTAQYMADARQADINQADAIAAEGDGHEGVTEESIFGTFGSESFDPGMFGGGAVSSCNFTAPLELMGKPIDLPPDWWMLAGMIGWLVVASAYIWLALQLGK